MHFRVLFSAILLCGVSVTAKAELREDSSQRVNTALEGLQTTISLEVQKINARIPRTEVEYTPIEDAILNEEYYEQRVSDYEKAQRLFESMGKDGEVQAREFRILADRNRENHKTAVKRTKRLIKEEEKELKKEPAHVKKDIVEARETNLTRVRNVRNELVRSLIQRLPNATSGMTTEETVLFMEGLATKFQPNNKVAGLLDVKQAFGPGYHTNDFLSHLQSRVIDVLGTYGTKDAWAAMGRIVDGTKLSASKLTALQHLLTEMNSAKALGLKSIEKPGPTLELVQKLQVSAPHKFNAETTYYDMESAEGRTLPYDPANPEFKRKGAKERFVPHVVMDPQRSAFVKATEGTTPVNRWSWLPGKLKRATEPAPPEPPPVVTEVVVPPVVTNGTSVPDVDPTHATTSPPEPVKVVEPTKVVEVNPAEVVNPPVVEVVETKPKEVAGRPVGEQPPADAKPEPANQKYGFERLMGINSALDLLITPILWLQNKMSRRDIASGPPRPQDAVGAPQNKYECPFGRMTGRYNHRGDR